MNKRSARGQVRLARRGGTEPTLYAARAARAYVTGNGHRGRPVHPGAWCFQARAGWLAAPESGPESARKAGGGILTRPAGDA